MKVREFISEEPAKLARNLDVSAKELVRDRLELTRFQGLVRR